MARRTPIAVSGVGEIAGRYDAFVLDVWGTVYDGGAAFPDALEALGALRRAGGRIGFLSNSPQTAETVAARLERAGIARDRYDAIVTSGGEVRARLADGNDPALAVFRGRVWQTGPGRFPETLPPGAFAEAAGVDGADWILNTGPEEPGASVADYEARLAEGAARGLPMLCANPDRETLHGTERQICAGALAERYAALGGRVHSIGKPYADIFLRCAGLLGADRPERVLVVGDNLETDILGARRAGMDSLLVADGVHGLAGPSGAIDTGRLARLAAAGGAFPDRVAARLRP